MHQKLAIISILLALCGCKTWQYHKPLNVEVANGVKFKLIDLALMHQNISQKQRVHGSFEELFFNVTIAVKLTPQNLEIIGIAPVMGTRIFTLKYNNKVISVEHSKLITVDPRIKPEYVVADLQLIYADVNEVRKNFDKKIMVKEQKKDGRLVRIFMKNSKPIIEITYSSSDLWHCDIHYKHIERNYEFFIAPPK